ncbi:hypothetical protein JW930_04635 [Candidatus Woesearchaeota archaeon]|nr:hypothetical protein [Candidatus Woesearchaeota archaeon]
MRKIIVLLLAAIFLVSACMRYEYPTEQTTLVCPDGTILTCPEPGETITEEEMVPIEEEEEETGEEGISEKFEEAADIVVYEGELVKLEPKVSDADGDAIVLVYSEPLDASGEWQTEEGDAGLYSVTVTASDGKTEVKKTVVILVKSSNEPPAIEIDDEITVKEGKPFVLQPEVSDPDGDAVTVAYSGWIDTDRYITTYDDAGEYEVIVTASDGKTEVSKTVKIIVQDVNRKPVLKLPNVEQASITVTEGELVNINTRTSDEDGDEVTVTFTEPLDELGEWQTQQGDAGEYLVTVSATDGKDTVSEEVLVTVLSMNMPPEFTEIQPITVNVGENLKDFIKPEATDPDEDPVEITYSGWLDDIDYEVTAEDAGGHTITVHYSDGVNEVTQDVGVTVNRPPIFEI